MCLSMGMASVGVHVSILRIYTEDLFTLDTKYTANTLGTF